MVLYVPAEKVRRLNTSYLPLPCQLYTSIEFFIQWIQPHLFHHKSGSTKSKEAHATNKSVGLWVNSHGGALEAYEFSANIWQAFNEFNPDLNITPIDFRRMTVTALFGKRITRPESETQEEFLQRHANLLNVSTAVMDANYNRFNLGMEYEETLSSINDSLNLGPEEVAAGDELDALMAPAIQQASKATTPSPQK